MKVIIAGSRNITKIENEISPEDLVDLAITESKFDVSCVVCGMARGADLYGKLWAEKYCIPVEEYPADWKKYGRSAGYKRNVEMAENANALVALWDGNSSGTGHMVNIAKDKNLYIYIKMIKV